MLWTQLLRGLGIVVSTDLEQLIDEMKGAQPTYFLNVPMLLERIKNGVEAKIRQKPAPIQWLYDSGKSGIYAHGNWRKAPGGFGAISVGATHRLSKYTHPNWNARVLNLRLRTA